MPFTISSCLMAFVRYFTLSTTFDLIFLHLLDLIIYYPHFQEGDFVESRVVTLDLTPYPDNTLENNRKSPVKTPTRHR